jgi:tetratricopeptide (TPR) repeat protein
MRARKSGHLLLLFAFLLCWAGAMGQGPGKTAFSAAENMRKAKRYAEAIEKYDEAIRLEKENYRYLFSRGKCYYEMKDYRNAISSLEEAVGVNREFTPAYSLLALSFLKNGDEANAMFNYDQAFKYETNPERKVQYKMQVVKYHMKSGDTQQAQSHIAEAKAVAPENLDILYYEAKLANQNGDHQTAKNSMLSAVSKLGEAQPAQSAKFYYELGLAYNNLGDYENAKKAWEKANFGNYRKLIAAEMSKNSPGFYYKKAVSYYSAGQFDQSRDEVRKALELQSNFGAGYLLMGKIDKKQGNYSQAITNYSTALNMENDPRRKLSLLQMLANLQMDSGDYSGALSSSNQVLKETPADLRILYIKALAQYNLGQYGPSIATSESAIVAPNIDATTKAKFQFLVGMASKNTDVEKAKTAFRSAMYGPFKPAAKNELDKLMGNG